MSVFPKVSCICPTRGRFDTLREAISFFLLQDYPNKELIIFNNHPEPIVPHPKLAKHNIKVINGGDYKGKSIQKVYADCLKHVSSDAKYISIWDDDDMYLPWHLSQNIEKLFKSGKEAIRPFFGYWQDINHSSNTEFTIISNTLEAGMIAKKELVFFNEENNNPNSPEYTHPHSYWVPKAALENKYLSNYEITAVYRWGYGKTYHHLQSVGPHKNDLETGKNQLLRPKGVKHLFYNFIEKVTLKTVDKKVVNLTADDKAEYLKKLLSYDIHKYDHVDKYKVWLYWDDENPPAFIKLCQNSIVENTFANVEILNDKSIKNLNLPAYAANLHPVQKSDYIRIHLLYHYGGWWFDSDTYVVGDLDEYYFKYLTENETVFPWEYNVPGNITTPLFSSKPYCLIIREAFDNVKKYLESKPQVGWSGIGVNGIMKAVDTFKHRGDWHFFGLPNIAVYGYNNNLISKWNFSNITPSKLQMIIFHWSQVGAELSWKIGVNTEEDINKIVENYPNMKELFEKNNLKY